MCKNSKLISVEGLCGAGKTTLINKLEKDIDSSNVIYLGGFNLRDNSSEFTRIANKMVKGKLFFDMSWMVEFHFLIAEMLYDVETIVKPALDDNKTVIYDNYWESIFIFQKALIEDRLPGADARNFMDYSNIVKSNTEYIWNIPKPDLVIYIESTVGSTIERLQNRDNIAIKYDYIDVQNKILELYRTYLMEQNVHYLSNNCTIEEFNTDIEELILYLKDCKYYE